MSKPNTDGVVTTPPEDEQPGVTTDALADNIANLQALLDASQDNLAKATKKATDQEKARKKLEGKLREAAPNGDTDSESLLLEAQEQIRVLTENLATANTDNGVLTSGRIEGKLAEALIELKDSISAGAGSLVSKEVMPSLKLIDGKITVVTDKGTPRLVAVDGGRQMKVTELIQEVLKKTPCLARATLKPGGNTKGNTEGIQDFVSMDDYNGKSSAERAQMRQKMSEAQLAALK